MTAAATAALAVTAAAGTPRVAGMDRTGQAALSALGVRSCYFGFMSLSRAMSLEMAACMMGRDSTRQSTPALS